MCRTVVVASLAAAGVLLLSGPTTAEPVQPNENPISVILKWRPAAPDPEVQDYVKATRPEDSTLTYKPLSRPKVARPAAKSKKGVRDMIADMDAKSAAVRSGAGRTAAAGPTTAQQLLAAGAESRRRAQKDFDLPK